MADIYGTTGPDTINGTSESDYLNGGTGDDTLEGGTGNDSLFGVAGNDILYGNDGDDVLQGDALQGPFSNNALVGGLGNDTLKGGYLADRYYFLSPNEGIDTILGFDGFADEDKIWISAEGFGININAYDAVAYSDSTKTLFVEDTPIAIFPDDILAGVIYSVTLF
jgi:Ca2+-binding RTX toxin-like protein